MCELDPAPTLVCMFVHVCPKMIARECERVFVSVCLIVCVCAVMLTQLGPFCSQIHLAERAEPIR